MKEDFWSAKGRHVGFGPTAQAKSSYLFLFYFFTLISCYAVLEFFLMILFCRLFAPSTNTTDTHAYKHTPCVTVPAVVWARGADKQWSASLQMAVWAAAARVGWWWWGVFVVLVWEEITAFMWFQVKMGTHKRKSVVRGILRYSMTAWAVGRLTRPALCCVTFSTFCRVIFGSDVLAALYDMSLQY